MIQEVFEQITSKTSDEYKEKLQNIHVFSKKSFKTNSNQTISMPEYIDINFEMGNNKTKLLELKMMKELMTQMNDKQNKQRESLLKRRISHLTVNKKEKIQAIQELHTLQNKMKELPFYYVLSKQPQNIQEVAQTSRNEKIKQKVIDKIMLDYPFNLFKFSKKSECESRETSKPYYISKKDLLNVIESNPDLTARFPKGYKSLKKEDLCGVIFK